MSEADFYPAGAYRDPSAPYNQVEVPERDFDVFCSQTLSRSTTITTQDYLPEYDEEDGHTYANTDDTDWPKAYRECSMTPLDVISAAEKIAKALLEEGKTKVGGIYLDTFVTECEGWNEDETEIMEE